MTNVYFNLNQLPSKNDGGQSCDGNRQSRLMLRQGKRSENGALSSTCLRSALVPLSFRSRYLRYAAVIFCVLAMSIGQAWAYYTPSADEVIILNTVYNSSATGTGYSNHSAIAWGGTTSSNSGKAGDPNNGGAQTSSNVARYSVKGNGSGKNITVSITGCSKIIVYHESHASRYLRIHSTNASGTVLGSGSASTYYTELTLTPATSYTLFLEGWDGDSQEDFYVYAVKLIKGASCASNPSDPTGLTAGTITSAGATFSITDAANTNNYEIVCKTTSGAPASDATPTATGTSKSITVSTLSASTTYYAWVRAVCDASYKSSWVALGTTTFTTLAAPTASFSNSTYAIGGSALDLSSLWSSNSAGSVTYSVEDAAGTGASVSTAAFSATRAGKAKVKAVQAANGSYDAITKYAYITVGSNVVGKHTVTYDLEVNVDKLRIPVTDSVRSTSLYLTTAEADTLIGTGLSYGGGAKASLTGKISAPASYDGDKYVYVQFTIADGYTFTPDSAWCVVQPVSDAGYAKLVLLDNNSHTITGGEISCVKGKNVHSYVKNGSSVALSGTVTLKIYCYGASTGTYRLGEKINIHGSLAAAAPSCTAPNHVDISGAWDKFGGETISLTATAYSSAGTGSPIADANITGWQWQKLIGTTWTDVSNGTVGSVVTSGATTKNLQITNCGQGNSGKYRCVVSTGATCSTASATATDGSEGYGVKVYVLECYTDGTTVYNFTRDGENQAGSVTINLSASTAYTFKVHADDYYGNSGTIDFDVTNWVCSTSQGNLTVNSGLGGTFTFDVEYSTGGNSSVEGEPELSVTYPRKTVYLKPNSDWKSDGAKFAFYYFHKNGEDTDKDGWTTGFLSASVCDGDVYPASIPQWNGVKIIGVRFNSSEASPGWNGEGHVWNQTSDLTLTSNDLVEITGWSSSQTYTSSYDAPTYTISFDGNGETSGSMTDVEDIECDASVTLEANAFVKTGYTFTGWKDGSSNDYADEATFSNIRADIELTAQWDVNSYDLTWNLGGGTTTSAGTGIANGVSANTTSSVAYGTSLTAPTVTKANYDFSAWSPAVASTMPAAATTYTATWTAKKYNVASHTLSNVTLTDGGATGDNKATYGTNYTATFAAAVGYNLPSDVTVSIGGSTKTKGTEYTWNSSTGVLTINGSYILGNIAITVTGVEMEACYEFAPTLTSGTLPLYSVVATSTGGILEVTGLKTTTSGSETISYDSNGLKLNGGGADSVTVELEDLMQAGTLISVKIHNEADGKKARGVKLFNNAGTTKATMTKKNTTAAADTTCYYTVVAGDGLAGSNKFRLQRSETTYIKEIKVRNCSSTAATKHNLAMSLTNVSQTSSWVAGDGKVVTGSNFTATFEANDCYTLPATVTLTIGGSSKTAGTDYFWDSSSGTLVIPGKNVTGNISITISGTDNHSAAGLSYDTGSVSKKTTDGKFTNTLSNPNSLTVSYESSDDDVAEVDSDGEVTIVGAGTCTITASADAQDCYNSGSAYYTLTVTACTTPTVSWSTTPANGIVGGSMTAAVTTNYSDGLAYSVTGATPSGCVTINSSGVISYVKPGTATVKATVTGDGTTYCEGPAEVSQAIIVHNAQVDDGTYVYYYSDETHFDGTNTYNNPEGNTPSTGENIAFSQSAYTLPNSESIDGLSVVVNSGCYDNKGNHINSYIKLTGGTSTIVFTIETGYTATIKIKAGGYSGAQPYYMKLNNEGDAIAPTTGSMGGAATIEDNFTELVWSDLEAGSYTFKASTSGKNLYVSQIDIETTSLGYAITKSASNGSISTKVSGSEVTYAEEDDEVTITATPNTGYNFTSWSVTQTTGGTPVEVGSTTANPTTFTMPAAAVTVNATFTAIDYKITHHWAKHGSYYIQVGTGSLTESNTTAHYGQTITLSTKSPSSTYKWGTWGVTMTDSGEPVVMATDSTFLMPDGDVTIYPQYGTLYTVTFNGNGAGRSVPSPKTQANAYASITMPAAPTSDSTFVGWVIGGTTYAVGASYTPTADVTAYAAWKEKCAGENTISIFNGATDTKNSTKSDTYNKSYTNAGTDNYYVDGTTGFKYKCTGIKDELLDISAFTDHGSYSRAVQMNGSGSSNYIELVVPTGYTASLSLSYCGYGSTNTKYGLHTSTISPNGSNCSTWNATAAAASTVYSATVSGIAAGTYYLAGGGSSCYFAKIVVTVTSTSSGSCYYVTYNGNGATGSGITNDATAYTSGATVTVASNGFSYPGYTFTGWNTKADGTGASKAAEATFTITQDTTLYAQWAPAELTLTSGADWTDPANWSPACVPTINHDVVINYNATLYGPYAEDDKGHGVAKSVKIKNGKKLSIWSEGSLIVAGGITAQHEADGSYEATTKNDLRIESSVLGNGTLICGGASDNTAATYEFYTRTFRYGRYYINQYVGIPFETMDGNQLPEFRIFIYADSTDSWVTPSSSTLEAFVAYDYIRAYSGSGWNEFDLNGTLNLPGITGDGRLKTLECGWRDKDADRWKGKTFPIPIDTIDGHQDFMFANSWTAPIDIASMEASDFDDVVNTIYIFNAGFIGPEDSIKVVGDLAGQWSAFPIESAGEMDNAVIPATQAFCVTATAANATLTLDYKKHVYDPAITKGVNNFPTRAPRRERALDRPLKLRMKVLRGTDIADQIYLFEREDFTYGFDNGWDGNKAFGLSTSPQLYTINEAGRFAVGAVPEMEGTEVGFKAATDANLYTFSFEYPEDAEPLYLYDRETQEYTQITNEATYTFATDNTAEHARFVLTRSNAPWIATGFDSKDVKSPATGVQKVLINDHIYILRSGHVYSVDGMLVK